MRSYALNRESESSGSQPVYRKLFPHGRHSSKNNVFEIKISKRRDWETPSLSQIMCDITSST